MTNSCDHTANGGHAALRDRGMTFIELLVSIVLLGIVVIAVLVSLQVTTAASVTDAEHARAYILLHEASDAVFLLERESCLSTPDPDAIALEYEAAFVGLTPPEGWASVTPTITQIEFLNAAEVSGETVYSWGSTCQEGLVDSGGDPFPLKSQKVTISVTSPDGSFTKIIETVKR